MNSSIGLGDKAEEREHDGCDLRQPVTVLCATSLGCISSSGVSGLHHRLYMVYLSIRQRVSPWHASPYLLPKYLITSKLCIKISSQAPWCCEAKAMLCEEEQKRKQLTSQTRGDSDEEHCQTSLSSRNPVSGSLDRSALGDQAWT